MKRHFQDFGQYDALVLLAAPNPGCTIRQLRASMALRPLYLFALISGFAFLLYAPFLAIQYDTNGIVEAASMEHGFLLPHNHMAYRPIVSAIFRISKTLGYSGNSLPLFQILNSVCGALGVGFCYLACERFMRSRVTAVLSSLWLGTTFSYWCISTDAGYIALAATFAAAAIAVSVRGHTRMHAIGAGVLAALCILTWQAGIFLLPGLIALWLLKADRRPIAGLVFTAGLLSASAYLIVGILYFDVKDARSFFEWIFRYGDAGTLTMWGNWSADRVPTAVHSIARSIIPTPLMVGPAEILTQRVQLGRIAIDMSAVAAAVLLIGMLLRTAKGLPREKRQTTACLLVGYLAFLPFIIWWDPGQPMWLVVPNIFLAALLGIAWEEAAVSRTTVTFAVCTAGIALTNFVTIIYPRHAELSLDRQIAQCVSENTTANDLILAAEWGWPDYLSYLHGREALSLISTSIPFTTVAEHLAMVQSEMENVQRRGGRVFTPSLDGYTPEHLAWLESQTRLTEGHLRRFLRTPGFTCGNRKMEVVVGSVDTQR